MARKKLNSLLESTNMQSPVVTESQTPAVPTSRPSLAAVAPEGDTGPRYLRMLRKEARIRPEQADELTVLVRQLNRARQASGERITDNTLIRVAIDLLLERRAELRGTTEAELRASLGL
ncbi:hypothetical protein KV097_18910 [Mumia sp. zg.B17]|uniref:hypothetical protein n=1 Tax=Mumia sp. zg.B17 TaxID=2855446 RepID=UPI001C6EAD9A|nr:hypothetical protein [Mumia sp. zg.B17]MBW9208015.1 hypothetical protein [Mumia sp. zg.B17]